MLHASHASKLFDQRLRRSQALQAIIFYADEATGGNVLQTSSSKKIFFTYMGLEGIGNQLDEVSWLPFAGIARAWLGPCARRVLCHYGLWPRCSASLTHRNGDRTLPLSLLAYVGDFDSIARSLGSLGASALKPRCLCENVLRKQSDVPSRNDFFVSEGCSEVARFRQIEQNELDAQFD